MANDTRNLDLFDFCHQELVEALLKNDESEWLEFKVDETDPEIIGKLCSALSNGAICAGREKGYVVWGVDNESRQIVGTGFNPSARKIGNRDLPVWLAVMLNPCPAFRFEKIAYPQGNVVLLEIPAAERVPTAFRGTGYVRIGSATTTLQQHPRIHERLIDKLGTIGWERAIARAHLEEEQVLELLDWEKYFERMKKSKPERREEIFRLLKAEELVRKNDAGKWDITNLGAILFARDLSYFGESMARKGVRLRVYRGDDKSSEVRDRVDGRKGYVLDLPLIEERVFVHVPVGERIKGFLREDRPDYPQEVIREILVNALVHQDFTVTGAGPNVHVFKSALEIDNPGESLVPPERMMDLPPISRNGSLSALMRRMGYCEEGGGGLDKVIKIVESLNSPPPEFRAENNSTRVFLYGPRDFSEMTKVERVRACYQHAVIMHLNGKNMTNATLRERLGLPVNGRGKVSRVIGDAIDATLIKRKRAKSPRPAYVPVWA